MRRTLDTNICSYILRRRPAHFVEHFAALDREQVWLSAIVAAELRFGALKHGSHQLIAAVESWLEGFQVLAWPVEATHTYAQSRRALEAAGQPIGNMDLMIAAHALAEDSVVITNNAGEFRRVPGLAVEEWSS